MVCLNIEELLKKNQKSKYWLVKQLDSNYTVINNMIAHNTTGINFETIDKLLNIFNCEFNDLFVQMNE
ncbi:hypothetical protein CLOSTMETH_03300 [[Clostridium] methylpentosum DSM 5476]|uniref:HTH cro/C1-type domain-containing protein n=1 Tax=[Clostridium] methylpentosum DSM 5476 TaxID=537013 RepID=C0EHA0_9FIRM|nr:hypothetical protein CLOSTMETH_03300 [[Clostridium] methylpentosum DSM 5476]MDY3987895.1 helix-turn-helix transcriptional regulator [Massilioclostridium sp.]MEE1490441.1 helix-turn-helix transcriptional regulator [Massilioclostridium sp.]